MDHGAADGGLALVGLIIIVGCIALYFLPAIVAFNRKHNSRVAILVVDFFFGWSFVGWVIALIWSFTGDTEANRRRDAIQQAQWASYYANNPGAPMPPQYPPRRPARMPPPLPGEFPPPPPVKRL